MMKTNNSELSLREHAKSIVSTKKKHTSEHLKTLSLEEIQAWIEELETDKIELEMQNEYLKQTQIDPNNTKESKEYEKELISNSEAQNKMLFLQSKYASMGETVGNIAHQWKQPLNAISSIQNSIKATLLFKGEMEKEKLLDSVETSFKLLQHLGETIDTFYGFLSQRNSSNSSFVLSNELETIRKITEYSFQNSNIQLIYNLQVNPTVQGNPNEFTHAMLNLILNAKNALDDSKPVSPMISIQVLGEEERCTIIVSDNAGGISLEPIESIFEWHRSSKEDSSGVGLYMTKKIIEERFGGTIQVENKNKGACFTLTLPYVAHEKQLIPYEIDTKPSLEQIKQLSKKIVELEELEKTLKKWADIFAHAKWAITIRIKTSKTFEMTNPAFHALYGYTQEELKTVEVADLFAPESLDILQKMHKEAFENGYAVIEAIHKRKDGSYFPVSIELIVIKDEQGEVLYHIANIWDLTEKKKFEERLKLKKFAIDNIKEAVFLADEHGNIAYVNDEACRSLDYSNEELLHMNVTDIDPNWPKERWPEFWNILKQEKSSLVEVMHRRKDGSLFPSEVRANYFEYNGVGYNLGLCRDITEQKAAQKELLLLGMALNNTTEAIYIMINADIVQVNDGACNMLGYTHEELTSMSILDIDPHITKEEVEAIILEGVQNKNVRFERQHKTKNGHLIDVEIVGTHFEYDEITYSFSSVRDISEQKKAREELLLKEFALDKINEAVYLIDKDAMFHYVNEGACSALGYSKEELLTMGVMDIDSSTSIEFWTTHWQNIKKYKSDLVLSYHQRKDGMIFPIEVSANYFEYNGKEYNLAVARNITERIRLEKQKDNERMRLFFERQLVGMAITSPQQGWLHANEKLQQMLGYTHEELTQLTWAELTYPEDLAEDVEQFEKLLRAEIEDYMLEKRFIRKDGTLVYTNLSLSCVRNDDKSVHYVLALLEDISERKAQEKALIQKEQQLRALADSSPGMMGSFHMRADGSIYMPYVSPNLVDIFGLQPQDIADDASSLMALTHPDDAERVENSIADSARTMSIWHEEYRINHPLKGERWMESNTKPELHHEDGIIWYGYIHDITERKVQEEALALKEREFRTLVENLPDNVIRYNSACQATYVSPRMERVIGLDNVTQMIGKTPLEVSAIDSLPTKYYQQTIKQVLASGEMAEIEIEVPVPSGEKQIHTIRFVAEHNQEGEIYSVLAIGTDMTERKRFEVELQAKTTLLHAILESSPGVITFALDKNYRYIAFDSKHAHVMQSIFNKEISIGMNMFEVINSATDRDIAKRSFDRALSGESFTSEEEYGDERLSRNHWQIFYAPIRSESGEIMGLTCFNIDITERKELEILLEKERKFLTDAQRVAHTGSWYLDIPNGVLSWSDETYRIFELDKENIDDLHKTFYESVHPDDREMVNAPYLESLKTGIPYEIEHRIVMSDGRIKYVIERCEHAYDRDRKPLYSIGTIQDITEHKLLEKEVEDSYNFLNNLVDSIPDPIFVKDREHRWILLNKANIALTGIDHKTLIGKSDYDIFPQEQANIFWEKDELVFNSGEVNINEEYFTSADGVTHTIETVKSTFLSTNGEKYLVGIIRDITKRKQAEDTIKALNETLEIKVQERTADLQKALEFKEGVINAIPDLMFEVDSKGTYLNVWATNTELLAAQKKLLLGRTFYDVLSAKAAETTFAAIQEANAKKLSFGKVIKIDLPQGERWFELSVSKKGFGETFIIISRDITERKTTEATIQELNTNLEKRVIERTEELQKALEFNEDIINAIPDLLFEIAPDGTYLGMWTRDKELLIAQKEFLLGKNIRDVLPREAVAVSFKTMEEVECNGSSIGNVYKLDLPDGTHWFELSMTKKESDGTYLALARDITERKLAQEEVQKLNNTLEKRVIEHAAQLDEVMATLGKNKSKK